jgi:hypothetical protein
MFRLLMTIPANCRAEMRRSGAGGWHSGGRRPGPADAGTLSRGPDLLYERGHGAAVIYLTTAV